MKWTGPVERKDWKRNAYRVLIGITGGKKSLGTSRSRWKGKFQCIQKLYLHSTIRVIA
jgi:hypothetical protein